MKGYLNNGKKYKLFIIICIIFIFFVISFPSYADTEQSPIVIYAQNDTDFAIQIHQLKKPYLQAERYAKTTENINSTNNNNRLLVVYNSTFDYSQLQGLQIIVFNKKNLCVLQFDSNKNAKIAYDIIQNWKEIKSVEFDKRIQINDLFIKQENLKINYGYNSWGVKVIGADKYSDYIKKNHHKKIVVAVVDTGVYTEHPFLKSRIENNGYDFTSENNSKGLENGDGDGHGTHVAGIIVDCTSNINDIRIMPIRVLDDDGNGWMSDVTSGILYSVDNGATIINLSLAGTHSSYFDSVINNVINKGAIVVCSAGNESVNIDAYNICPAHIEQAITVGAINRLYYVDYYSNYGSKLDVVAPGGKISSCSLDGGYIIESGTSMAAAHVSACAALLKMKYTNANCEQISSILKRSATIPDDACDYGSGIVDMRNLLDPISNQQIKIKSKYTYTGQSIIPLITISRNGEKLFYKEDYIFNCFDNINIGTASIIIRGKGTYNGTETIHFKIVPVGTTIKSLKAKNNGFIIKWKKQTNKTNGYQIQYATNKKFKKAHKFIIKNKNKTKYKFSKLKSKKKYYVRIRTYKVVNKKRYYSFWSKTKTIRTK